MWDWNLQTGELWRNHKLFAAFGYASGDIGNSAEDWANLIHPDDRQRVERSFSRALDESGGDCWEEEYRYRRRDGTYADVLDRGYVSRNESGRPLRMVGAMMDITSRKRAEIQYRTLFENLNDSVTVIGIAPEGISRFKEVNDLTCRMLGYTREEMLQLTPFDVEAPEFAEQRSRVIPAILAGEPVLFETEFIAKDGRRTPVEISARMFPPRQRALIARYRPGHHRAPPGRRCATRKGTAIP
jgi:PAS domain S-box-containing protein